MKLQSVLGLTLIAVFITHRCWAIDKDECDTCFLKTLQLMEKFGYPSEAYNIRTSDGYILEIHRMRHGRVPNEDEPEKKKLPVLVMHGLVGSSSDFLFSGPENGLGFILADAGYDVWLGNLRGNVYCRAHVSLSPEEDEFWDFSWHESGIYDLPAQIDFVLNFTKQEQLIFIGYSLGNTIYFVLTTMLPEYNDKIALSFAMAPVAFTGHVKSPLLVALSPFSVPILSAFDFLSKGEFLPGSKVMKKISKFVCEIGGLPKLLCMNSIFLLVGFDHENFDKDIMGPLVTHFPAGYSVRAMTHYSQLHKSGKFAQYDFGRFKNRRQYGTRRPPDYPLEKVTSPMIFYQAKNDFLGDKRDVAILAKQLPSLLYTRVIDHPKFSHLDFIVSKEVREQVYEPMLEDLRAFFDDMPLNETRASIVETSY